MKALEIINYIGLIGSFTLAISGSMKAMDQKFDPFGVFIIAFVTAVGGGTLRDILLTDKAVFWIENTTFIYLIIAGSITAMILRNRLFKLYKILLLFDTIGLGIYTIIGVQVGINYELSPIICIILGILTGSFGGVLRDILVNEVPVIFHKEIYATASILGGVLYLILLQFNLMTSLPELISILFIIALRIIIIKLNLKLPNVFFKEETDIRKSKTD